MITDPTVDMIAESKDGTDIKLLMAWEGAWTIKAINALESKIGLYELYIRSPNLKDKFVKPESRINKIIFELNCKAEPTKAVKDLCKRRGVRIVKV